MKAAVANTFGSILTIEDVQKPTIEPHQILVKIHACGVCHTDLHACHGDWPVKPTLPLIPGHEGVGEIVELGSAVTHLSLGDRVGIPWLYSACGHCEYCLAGQESLCMSQQNAGYSVAGSYAEYCAAHADYVIKVPDNLNYVDAAPLFCAGVTTYKALKVSDAKPGQWVAVFGVGGLGHLAVQYAVAMGLRVVAVDTGEAKRELATSLGAEHFFDFKTDNVVEDIREATGGVHGSVCTAVSKAGFRQSYDVVRRGGKCVLVGLPPEDMPLPIFDTVLNGVSVVGSIVGTRKDLEECLEFAARGKVKAIITEKKLDEINAIFEDMEKGDITGRIVMSL
ncbi:alcohol dehydrogenase AdhP [Marinomonas gallaica]|uniref:alcohol dehydrogenase AdhP n=1 Tax=Marinomonas gallaica TaxID=1806667 RepID=UPI003A943F80